MNKNTKIKIGAAVGTVIALIVALIVFIFTIPRDYRYEKSVHVVAQQRMVFVFIGELQRWKEWTTWAARDPEMNNEHSTPSWGVGATYHWRSRSQGSGDATVTGFTKDAYMSYDLTPEGYDTSKWEFRLTPAPRQGVIVTWNVSGQFPEDRLARFVAYLMMWGLPGDMEQSLDRLKKHAELHEAYQVKGGWE
jgi:hypothetical protein